MIEKVGVRKTKRGWLGNIVKQTYARDDIVCGIEQCPEHSKWGVTAECGPFEVEMDREATIYFVDEETLLNQTDILENCEEIANLVVIQSLVEQLKLKYSRSHAGNPQPTRTSSTSWRAPPRRCTCSPTNTTRGAWCPSGTRAGRCGR